MAEVGFASETAAERSAASSFSSASILVKRVLEFMLSVEDMLVVCVLLCEDDRVNSSTQLVNFNFTMNF